MIMSVHEPLSRKRSIGSENVLNVKRHCQDMESESAVTDAVYAVLVKTALESLEKVFSFPPPPPPTVFSRDHKLVFMLLTISLIQ